MPSFFLLPIDKVCPTPLLLIVTPHREEELNSFEVDLIILLLIPPINAMPRRVIQLDSDDSDNEPTIKPDPEDLPPLGGNLSPKKNRKVMVSSTRVDGGKKASKLEARRKMMERKKRRKSALADSESDENVDYDSASSSDGGLAPVFSSRMR